MDAEVDIRPLVATSPVETPPRNAGLSSDCRNVGRCPAVAGHRLWRGLALGPVRRRRRFPADAAADPHRHPLQRRGRLRRQPDARRLRLRSDRAVAARQCRFSDGRGAHRRRLLRIIGRRAAVRLAAPRRAGRPGGGHLLRGGAGQRRRADGAGKPGRHPAAQAGAPGAAARAPLDARAALQDAVPQVAAVHLRHPAAWAAASCWCRR